MARVDPITYEVLRARLDGIVREMEKAVFRTGYSTIVQGVTRLQLRRTRPSGTPRRPVVSPRTHGCLP